MGLKLLGTSLNELSLPVLLVIVLVIVMLFYLLIRGCCLRGGNNALSRVALYYDDCICLTYQHQYVVRLLHGPKSSSYDQERTTIVVELDHSMHKTVRIPFTPNTMERSINIGPHRAALSFVRSKTKYANIRSCSIHHNGRGSILVAAVQVQHIDQPNALTALIGAPIFGLAQTRNLTQYPFNREMQTTLEEELKPTRNVTMAELAYMFYTTINVIFLMVVHGFQVQCSTMEGTVSHDDECGIASILVISGVTGALAFLVLLGMVLPLRYIIRPYFHNQLGRGSAAVLRIIYMVVIIVGGMVTGLVSAEYSLRTNTVVTQMKPWLAWLLCCIFASFLVLLLLAISLPLAVWLKFFDDPKREQDDKKDQGIAYLLKQAYAWGGRGGGGKAGGARRAKADTKTDDTVTSEVRQYKSADAFDEAVSYMSTMDHTVTGKSGGPKANHAKPQSPNVRDDGIAGALVKGGIVRSISQFGGSSESDKPTKTKPRQIGRGGGGKLPMTRKKVPPAKSPSTPTAPPRTTTPTGKRMPAASTGSPTETDTGDAYYRTMIKMNKVKSVSQYTD